MAKILIADDSSLARKLLKRALVDLNHEVVAEAESGEQAILEFKKCSPDIIAMDVDMPGIGGIEAAKRITASFPEARIIFVSAHEQNDLKNLLAENSLKPYIILKPVEKLMVGEAIEKALSKQEEESIELGSAEVGVPIEEEKENLLEGLDLKIEDKVTLSHHSGFHPFTAVMAEMGVNSMVLKLTKEFALYNFYADDPVVVGLISGDQPYICQCNIVDVHPKNYSLKLNIEYVGLLRDNEIMKRLPASLYLDIKDSELKKKSTAVAKNINLDGMTVKTKSEFEVTDKVVLDLYLDKNVVSLNAEVISKNGGALSQEYGLAVMFRDPSTRKALKVYMELIRDEHEKALADLIVK